MSFDGTQCFVEGWPPPRSREEALAQATLNRLPGCKRQKRQALEVLLRDSEWANWSDRRIAENCGVDRRLVARVRRGIQQVSENETSEAELETSFVNWLYARGARCRQQIACGAGIADVVTETTIWEVKRALTRRGIFEAIGQAVLYRQSIDPGMSVGIAGVLVDEVDSLLSQAVAGGVAVAVHENNRWRRWEACQ